MPRLTSRHDDTPDAYRALRNHYQASLLRRKQSSRSLSGSPSSASKKGSPARRAAPQEHAAPVPRQVTDKARVRAVEAYEHPARRPNNLARGTLWPGIEPDVDDTFFLWDGSIGHVPIEAIQNGIRDFEEGVKYLGYFSPDSKAGIVHAVANEMLRGGLSSTQATFPQIRFFLSESYRSMVTRDPCLALPPHWNLRTVLNRTDELEWLKYQAELRWWRLAGKSIDEMDRRRREPSESEVDAMFKSFTRHAELPEPTSPPHNPTTFHY